MPIVVPILTLLVTLISTAAAAAAPPGLREFDAPALEDRIRGGMLGQIIGNLNGLPHEFKYIDEPGDVEHYTPSLPDGAKTDDDTDIEWVYLREIARRRQSRLPHPEISALWKRHINRRIFCANRYARDLMELGLDPPLTGNIALNPWSEFNISGQFLSESFGLMAPAMPQTAARIGLHYTQVAIDGEPAQTTQLFTTMIALAFVEADVQQLIDASAKALDPLSTVSAVVHRVRAIHAARPNDWRAARRAIRDEWQRHGGGMRDRNGYELNTACTLAALLYGRGDFTETLRIAFNLGWDCDNNAATAGAVLGVIRGRRWIDAQGWAIVDRYRNTTRDEMLMDETLTTLEDALIACARVVIAEQGGNRVERDGRAVYKIPVETPVNVASLATADIQRADARQQMAKRTAGIASGNVADRALAAYAAICLGDAARIKKESPAEWRDAMTALKSYPQVVRNLFHAPLPGAAVIQAEALRAGLHPPDEAP